MNESVKKKAIIAAIFICISVLIVVLLKSCGKGDGANISAIPSEDQTWMRCVDCETTYQMPTRAYWEYVQKNYGPLVGDRPLPCQECEGGAYRAEECQECGAIYFWFIQPADGTVRCPECGFAEKDSL